MTRLESCAWSLAGGSACVFALAVVLGGLPWQVGFAAVAVAVLTWGWLSPVIGAAAIGGVAWLCVTGFDVHRLGDVRITGRDDVLRAVVLVLAGVLTASAHALAEVTSGGRPTDPLWAEFHETGLGPNVTTEGSAEVPRQRGPVEQRLFVHLKEPRDG
ncbi:hypothetical protein [Actinomadura sp. DC4]|uniref:hypothetical protein n=1 Tax=Actinomadura sp. DC4 TaxID=3055069 RepID=UPI0025AF903B|nr:hypothetical protein [Actinomadura sp. DC4]MDN3355038.1 hypothetical protein [Actinomadura sp. DC4]